ncbi:MAG: NAD-dependent deacylase [Betaproteobacteria bacterium]|nr:NAD-dependent deacylase [Betaproteobacteria bacterium]
MPRKYEPSLQRLFGPEPQHKLCGCLHAIANISDREKRSVPNQAALAIDIGLYRSNVVRRGRMNDLDYEWRRMKVMRAQPNSAHLAIAAFETRVPRLTVVTQNVDDLHERAGSRDVLHLHGQLNSPFCFACRRPAIYPDAIPDEPEGGRQVEPPRCSCGGRIRPGVVWFGEMLPKTEWDAANDAANHCDVFLSIGTSSVVQPAASLTMMAIQRGAITIQVNPNPTALDDQVTLNLPGPAGQVLPELVETIWGGE